MARIRIVNYGNCQESIVVLRKWRGLSALAIERSHYRDRYHRKSHYQPALLPAPEGLEEKPGLSRLANTFLIGPTRSSLPRISPYYPILPKYSQPTVPRHLASLQLEVAADF